MAAYIDFKRNKSENEKKYFISFKITKVAE